MNPGVSYSEFELADPARKCSRLGANDLSEIERVADRLSGLMFHCNCENADFAKFSAIVDRISRQYAPILKEMDWVSLGGGIYFTQDGYPIGAFIEKIAEFSKRFSVQVYLEPGEAVVTRAGYLVTQVLDIVHNGLDIAVVDAAVETHMLDLMIYRTDAKIEPSQKGNHPYQIAGRTCLAGDIFGTYPFAQKLEVGSRIALADAAGYTMVKKNWFNGVPMPAVVVRHLDGRAEVVKTFRYEDYLAYLS